MFGLAWLQGELRRSLGSFLDSFEYENAIRRDVQIVVAIGSREIVGLVPGVPRRCSAILLGALGTFLEGLGWSGRS